MKRFTFFAIAVFLLAVSSPALSATITFDPVFPSIPGDVTVQYFDGGLSDPLGALPAPNNVALASTPSAIPGGGNALLTWDLNQPTGGPLTNPLGVLFTFTNLQTTVSAVGNDFGGDPVQDNEVVYLTAFNAVGNVIGSAFTALASAIPDLKPVSFTSSGNDIKYVAFTWLTDLGYYSVDNVAYTAVPVPPSLLLLGSGLLGLVLLRRKRAC